MVTPRDFVHRLTSKVRTIGCILFDQSKSGLCDPNLDFSSDYGLNLNGLKSERSTSALGSFRLVSQCGFRFLFSLTKLLFDRRSCSFIDKHGGSRLVQAKDIYTPSLFYAAKGL